MTFCASANLYHISEFRAKRVYVGRICLKWKVFEKNYWELCSWLARRHICELGVDMILMLILCLALKAKGKSKNQNDYSGIVGLVVNVEWLMNHKLIQTKGVHAKETE